MTVLDASKPHNVHTAERACAYLEKLQQWPAELDDWRVEKIPRNRRLSAQKQYSRDGRKRKLDEIEQSPSIVNGSVSEVELTGFHACVSPVVSYFRSPGPKL